MKFSRGLYTRKIIRDEAMKDIKEVYLFAKEQGNDKENNDYNIEI